MLVFIPAVNSFAFKAESPEDLILNASQMLQNLDMQFNAIKTIRRSKGFHINNEEATAFLEKADLFYDQKIPYASLYWYSKYLNLIQVPPAPTYLHIQKNLFSIYSQTRQYQNSFQSAKKYTASFLTAQDQNFSDLEEILNQLYFDLKYSTIKKNDLYSFISGFSAIDFPQPRRYQMMYLIAKIANQGGLYKVASQWLANASAFSSDMKMFARTKIFQAIIAIQLNKYERAHHILTLAMDQISENSELLPFYKLFLGRLNFVLNKPMLAEQNYKSISSESPVYFDSVFELCFLYASVRNWEEAKTQANLYLGANLDSRRTNMVRRLMPFFDMQAGHFDQAKSNLNVRLETIKNLVTELGSFSRSRYFDSYGSFKELEASINRLVSIPPLSKKLKTIENNLVNLNEQANSLEGNLQYSLKSISNAEITSYNPDLHHHYLQLLAFGNDILKIGHMLVSAEKSIYKDKLSRSEDNQILALWNRREKMMTEKYRYHRDTGPLRKESVFLQKNAKVGKLWKRMQKINAMMTASNHMLNLEETEKKQALAESLEYLDSLSSQLNTQVTNIINVLREKRFVNQANVFANMPQKVFFTRYSDSLKAESNLYLRFRSNFKTASGRIRAEKLTAIWQIWKSLSKNLAENLRYVEQRIKENIDGAIASLSNLQSDLNSQRSYIKRSSNRFESIAANSISLIASHYLFQIRQLKAKYKKWIADIKWNQYEIIKTSENEAIASFEAEKKEFENSLFDIKHGILETW